MKKTNDIANELPNRFNGCGYYQAQGDGTYFKRVDLANEYDGEVSNDNVHYMDESTVFDYKAKNINQ